MVGKKHGATSLKGCQAQDPMDDAVQSFGMCDCRGCPDNRGVGDAAVQGLCRDELVSGLQKSEVERLIKPRRRRHLEETSLMGVENENEVS